MPVSDDDYKKRLAARKAQMKRPSGAAATSARINAQASGAVGKAAIEGIGGAGTAAKKGAGRALTGVGRSVARFAKGAVKSKQPVTRANSYAKPRIDSDTLTGWADSGPAVNWRGSRGGWTFPERIKGTKRSAQSYKVTRGDQETRTIAKIRNEARKKIAKTPQGYPGGSYHMPGGKGGEGMTAAWKRQNAPKDWQR